MGQLDIYYYIWKTQKSPEGRVNSSDPTGIIRWPYVYTKLVHRLRRWPNIGPTYTADVLFLLGRVIKATEK